MMHDLLGPINSIKFSRDELLDTGIVSFMIEQCIRKADTTSGEVDTSKNDRQAAICLLCSLWGYFPEKFDEVVTEEQTRRIFSFHAGSAYRQPELTLG